jgi:hypothetical protein
MSDKFRTFNIGKQQDDYSCGYYLTIGIDTFIKGIGYADYEVPTPS